MYIGFSTGNGFISRSIRKFRGSEYSHVFEVVGEIAGDLITVEAVETGVAILPLHKHVNDHTKMELWEVVVDSELLQGAVRAAMARTQRAYGFMQLIGFIWVWFWQLFGIAKNNPFQDGIICSEETLLFLKDCGYDLVKDFRRNDTAPDHLLKAIKSDPTAKLVAIKDFNDISLRWV